MKEKNRFSQLLERLMTMADLKNSTLAQALQYDVSYISKWASGRVLPTEKNAEKIFRGISRCVVDALEESGRSALYLEYQVERDDDLELAIYDNLEAEYAYVRDQERTGALEGQSKVNYFPELTLPQFIAKMRHPDLRRVKDLEVVAVIDILELDHEYQLMIAELEKRPNVANLNYPGVHFSMVIDLDERDENVTYNVVFLMNLLTNLSNVNFRLYANSRAAGKIIFTVKGAYAISAMIATRNQCLAVTTCEEQAVCDAMHNRLKTFCNKESLLVRDTTMEQLLGEHGYIQTLFARDLQWLLGRMTEHFVPEALFEELMSDYVRENTWVDLPGMRKARALAQKMMEESKIQILLHEDAITGFAVSGEIDFYNCKMKLNTEQRLSCMQNLLALMERNPELDIRLIRGGLITDFRHIPNPTLFLSDSLCYLRLERQGNKNNIGVLNKMSVSEMFRKFFREVWGGKHHVEVSDRDSVREVTSHLIRSIQILNQVEGGF